MRNDNFKDNQWLLKDPGFLDVLNMCDYEKDLNFGCCETGYSEDSLFLTELGEHFNNYSGCVYLFTMTNIEDHLPRLYQNIGRGKFTHRDHVVSGLLRAAVHFMAGGTEPNTVHTILARRKPEERPVHRYDVIRTVKKGIVAVVVSSFFEIEDNYVPRGVLPIAQRLAFTYDNF